MTGMSERRQRICGAKYEGGEPYRPGSTRLVRGPAYGPLFHFISVRFNAGQITSPRILEWRNYRIPGKRAA